ncbi:MAG TPA: dicarboxylate/amino acid:cation symporter [Candidatus Tectomicrobia bacterium]|nr:dicarboxylate/amino acid:cation symporter [Candidatus Tectomicrobia bacterium]
MPLHTKILVGLLLGAGAGVAVNLATGGGPSVQRLVSLVTEPVGRVWLNALIMVVIPLVVSTLAVGVAGLGSVKRLGRIGALTLISFLVLTTLSTALGLALVNLVQPGAGLDADTRARLMEAYRGESQGAMGLAQGALGVDLFVRMVPRNPIRAAADGEMLAVIVFALFVGVALTMIADERAAPLRRLLESVAHVTIAIIELVMRAAPVGVFALIFSVTARFGFGILLQLLQYVLTVIGGLAIFLFVGYPLVLALVARRRPLEFLRKARLVMLTAFSTSSSNATLPTTLRTAQNDLGVAPEIAGFVVPLGATMNMNGTALFEGVTVLFIAQVFGVHLDVADQLVVVLLSVVTAIGTAGVPGGSIPLLMMVLGIVGVPMEGIAIVLGVDRILDMCRTVLNVTGDLVTAVIVDRFEGPVRPEIVVTEP